MLLFHRNQYKLNLNPEGVGIDLLIYSLVVTKAYWNVSGVFHRMLNTYPLEFSDAQKKKLSSVFTLR